MAPQNRKQKSTSSIKRKSLYPRIKQFVPRFYLFSLYPRKRLCRPRKQQIVSRFNLLSLPMDLVSEIIVRIAANSAQQLAWTKVGCKELQKVGEEKHVYQRVSIKEFSKLGWFHPKETALFLNKCQSFKNPEALYRRGVIDYFRGLNKQSAMYYLKEAADYGHMGAYYAMSIIFLFSNDDQEKQKGATRLLHLKRLTSSNESKIKEYRTSLDQILREIWIAVALHHNRDQIERRRCESQHNKCKGWKNREWHGEGYEKMCEACQIDEEVAYVVGFL